jgi:hypothetical protein
MSVHGRSDLLQMAGGSRSHRSLADLQHCFQALWQYRGMSSLATALRIKLTEVLYVPRAWHWFSLLRSQADTSRSAHLSYPEGTFPAGGKFVHVLPVKHPPEDQIIHLELSASHKPLVVVPERLPVACIFNSRLPSLLIDQVDIPTPKLILCGFVVCLDTQRAHGDFGEKDGPDSIHHEERSLSRGSTGRCPVAP